MPLRHANQTSFKKGDPRLAKGSEGRRKQSETLRQQYETGKRSAYARVGPDNPHWKPIGTRSVDRQGYIKIKVAERTWAYEHRVIAEQMLGRPLERGEHVHHLSADKTDNRPENLRVMSRHEHSGLPKDKNGYPRCPVCGYRHPPH